MMIGNLRVKSPWSQLGLLLGLLGAGLMLTSIVLVAVFLTRGLPIAKIDQLDWSQPGVVSAMKLAQALSSVTIFLIPAFLFSIIVFRGKRLYFMGIRNPVKPQMYTIAIICILVAMPFVMWLGDLNQRIPLPEWMTRMEKDAGKQMTMLLKASSTIDVLVNVFVIALLPAFCEELLFRGVLQRIIINICKSPLAGILLTAIIFSAAHLQFQGFLPRMFLGVILGALFWYSGSLWPGIMAHFVNNAVQVVAVSYAPEYIDKNPSLPVIVSLASGAVVAALLWYYRSISTASYQKVYEPDMLNSTNEFLA